MTSCQQDQLLPADTPPDSPIDLISPQSDGFPSRRIHIDDTGMHDFEFKQRLENPGPRKLKKLGRCCNPNQRSISSMADIPTRSSSLDSETGSVRKRFSLLFSSNRDSLHGTNRGKSTNLIPDVEDDPLPDTKKDLEVRLNHHLVELDMLKKTIQAANDVILQHRERYEILLGRQMSDMRVFMRRQKEMVYQARENRDSYVQFVSFHRRQIERIKNKRIEIETEAGLDPTLPEVFKSMWTDDDWGKLFST